MDAVSASSSPAPPPPPPLRIVICPWLAFGHMLPYLELAERLASRGHRVSYVSTPRNLERLPPRRHAVDLVALPLPRVEGLPEGADSTTDVPGDKHGHRRRVCPVTSGRRTRRCSYLSAPQVCRSPGEPP
jgi:hypothetical protein